MIKPSWMERLLGRRARILSAAEVRDGDGDGGAFAGHGGAVLGAAESGVQRSWDRAVKGYENLQLVYEVQSQLEEWAQQNVRRRTKRAGRPRERRINELAKQGLSATAGCAEKRWKKATPPRRKARFIAPNMLRRRRLRLNRGLCSRRFIPHRLLARRLLVHPLPPMRRASRRLCRKPIETVSPPLAFVLGFIPGVGAVYNGQYAKGLVHVVIFGSIISILSSGAAQGFEPLFGLMIPTFVFYMALRRITRPRSAGMERWWTNFRAWSGHAARGRDFRWRRCC